MINADQVKAVLFQGLQKMATMFRADLEELQLVIAREKENVLLSLLIGQKHYPVTLEKMIGRNVYNSRVTHKLRQMIAVFSGREKCDIGEISIRAVVGAGDHVFLWIYKYGQPSRKVEDHELKE